jgi:hypothetical protein
MVRRECHRVDRPIDKNRLDSAVYETSDVPVAHEFRSAIVDDAIGSVASVRYFQTRKDRHTVKTSFFSIALTRMPVSFRHMKQLELRMLNEIVCAGALARSNPTSHSQLIVDATEIRALIVIG